MKFILLAVVLLAYSFSYTDANVVRLVFIDYSEMRESSERAYFSDALAADDELQIRDLLTHARSSIETHYGEVSDRPAVVVLSEREEFECYGLGSRLGMFLFTPWGAYLLFSYHKADLDVAHELVHAEVVQRVGYFKRQMDARGTLVNAGPYGGAQLVRGYLSRSNQIVATNGAV